MVGNECAPCRIQDHLPVSALPLVQIHRTKPCENNRGKSVQTSAGYVLGDPSSAQCPEPDLDAGKWEQGQARMGSGVFRTAPSSAILCLVSSCSGQLRRLGEILVGCPECC